MIFIDLMNQGLVLHQQAWSMADTLPDWLSREVYQHYPFFTRA